MPEEQHPTYSYSWFIRQFEQAHHQAHELFTQTKPELLTRRPAPERWSAVECVCHLVAFGDIYSDCMAPAIDQGNETQVNNTTTFAPRIFWQWVIDFFEPPYNIKMQTIQSFRPDRSEQPQPEQALRSFSNLQKRFIQQLNTSKTKGLNLSREKVPHPVLSFLKMSLSECLALTDAHQRRHLWQAQQTILKLQES